MDIDEYLRQLFNQGYDPLYEKEAEEKSSWVSRALWSIIAFFFVLALIYVMGKPKNKAFVMIIFCLMMLALSIFLLHNSLK